jgi:hypothetical protein
VRGRSLGRNSVSIVPTSFKQSLVAIRNSDRVPHAIFQKAAPIAWGLRRSVQTSAALTCKHTFGRLFPHLRRRCYFRALAGDVRGCGARARRAHCTARSLRMSCRGTRSGVSADIASAGTELCAPSRGKLRGLVDSWQRACPKVADRYENAPNRPHTSGCLLKLLRITISGWISLRYS